MTKPMHITVGVATRGNTSLSYEVDLVKAAILYGDSATLCSLGSAMILSAVALGEFSLDQRLDFMVSIANQVGGNSDELARGIGAYRAVRRKKHKNRDELLHIASLKRTLDHHWSELRDVVYGLAETSGFLSILEAVDAGFLTLHPYEHFDDTDVLINEFVGSITRSIGDLNTYPLLDDQVGDLVRAGLREGVFEVSDAGRERAKAVGLAAGLIEQLPLFEYASMSEIIDIRRELSAPLVRFRSAVMTLSDSVERASWDEDFPHDVETVLRRDIEPAVLEITEALETNKYLKQLVAGVLRKPLVVGSATGLGLLVSSVDAASHEASKALGIVAGAGLVALDAYKDWKARQREIETNRLFFYYKAGDLLRRS